MIKAIIFDCFGVIVGKGFNYTYRAAGGDPKADQQFIRDRLGQAHLGVISEEEFNVSIREHLDKTEEEWKTATKKAQRADPKILSYIAELKKDYKTALLSNSYLEVLIKRIGQDYLNQCFDAIVCSAEVGLIKPDPEIYKLTTKRLNVEPNECVFIDNYLPYVNAAIDTGMQGVHYTDLASLKESLKTILSH